VTYSEAKRAIDHLKCGKSTGIDNIPSEILKCEKLLPPLCALFDTSLKIGIFPSMWSKSVISPIPKRGKDPRIPNNTRGISLVSTVYKIFATILNNRLVAYLEITILYVMSKMDLEN
jgi:hypothetical protein